MSRSAWTTLSIPGRRIFSATTRPSRRTARWTCEIDAEATGAGSIAREDLRRRPAVLLGQDRLGLGERERPDVVAERRQLGRVGLGQQVGPGAQELAELDERRAEVLADQPEPPRRGPAAGRRRPARPARAAGRAPPGGAPRRRPDSRTAPASPGSGGTGAGRGGGRRFRGSTVGGLPGGRSGTRLDSLIGRPTGLTTAAPGWCGRRSSGTGRMRHGPRLRGHVPS